MSSEAFENPGVEERCAVLNEFIDGIVDECLALGLKNLWIQEGIINEPAAMRAVESGLRVVMDRCIYRDYRRYCH
jgi:predicted CoA-binding protein